MTRRHLSLGTTADNLADMAAKGRANNGRRSRTRCKRGHEFTPENTYVYNGHRSCRACAALRAKEQRRS